MASIQPPLAAWGIGELEAAGDVADRPDALHGSGHGVVEDDRVPGVGIDADLPQTEPAPRWGPTDLGEHSAAASSVEAILETAVWTRLCRRGGGRSSWTSRISSRLKFPPLSNMPQLQRVLNNLEVSGFIESRYRKIIIIPDAPGLFALVDGRLNLEGRFGHMDVTLQYFDDCPNWRVVEQHLIALGREFEDLHVELQLIDTPEDAERYGFRGSPGILIDGVDPFARPDDPIGLSCRVYPAPGGLSGSPTLDELRAALAGSA